MNNTPRILKELGWNQRVLTFEDFEDCCSRLGVKWFFTEEDSEGMTFSRRGYPIIILSRKLTGFMLLFVAWHELVHYLLHPPALRYFARGTLDKIEAEANAIAICCVIPRPVLRKVLTSPSLDEWLLPRDLLKERCDVLTLRGD
jgi:Zn-dependent peptidase ImmA (M78 family)